jgi:uncharacterized protein (DUF983 family)
MTATGSFVPPPEGGTRGIAPSYMDAMHGLCIKCHEQKLKEGLADQGPDFAGCRNCHRDSQVTDFHDRPPYVAE